MKVPFIDLTRQYEAIRPEIDAAIADVLTSGHFILGRHVAELERELAAYCGAAHGIGVASGTDALRLALQAVGVGPGDEVITSPFTFIAAAEVVSQVGAVPVFADIEADTFNLDPDQVAKKLTARTKAIIPVHLYGQTAEMAPIMELARQYELPVIEDACQAICAEYRGQRAGSLGHVACFSFFPTKNLGGYGDGGFLTTGDAKIAERVRMLRAHGSREKYVHEELGWSSRLDELQAAVLRVKLRHLDAWTARRREHAGRYREGLQGVPVTCPVERDGHQAVYHLFTIRTSERDALQRHLRDLGIATMVHYPMPCHLQPLYRDRVHDSLPASEAAGREVLSLPLFPEMEPAELDAVVTGVRAFFGTRS